MHLGVHSWQISRTTEWSVSCTHVHVVVLQFRLPWSHFQNTSSCLLCVPRPWVICGNSPSVVLYPWRFFFHCFSLCLSDVRRLVVALSRARLGLYILGRLSLFQRCYELIPAFERVLNLLVKFIIYYQVLALAKAHSTTAPSQWAILSGTGNFKY